MEHHEQRKIAGHISSLHVPIPHCLASVPLQLATACAVVLELALERGLTHVKEQEEEEQGERVGQVTDVICCSLSSTLFGHASTETYTRNRGVLARGYCVVCYKCWSVSW
jgi:hypothetical protein